MLSGVVAKKIVKVVILIFTHDIGGRKRGLLASLGHRTVHAYCDKMVEVQTS